jgi:hypothetical protein
MIEDEERTGRVDRGEQDGYAYDFFKFLTSLSLLTMAGIFAISQMDGAMSKIGKPHLVGTLGIVALAGMTAFSGVATIVNARTRALDKSRNIRWLLQLAPGLYGGGVGATLMMFLEVMY